MTEQCLAGWKACERVGQKDDCSVSWMVAWKAELMAAWKAGWMAGRKAGQWERTCQPPCGDPWKALPAEQ